jgi:hypothetical protein
MTPSKDIEKFLQDLRDLQRQFASNYRPLRGFASGGVVKPRPKGRKDKPSE